MIHNLHHIPAAVDHTFVDGDIVDHEEDTLVADYNYVAAAAAAAAVVVDGMLGDVDRERMMKW